MIDKLLITLLTVGSTVGLFNIKAKEVKKDFPNYASENDSDYLLDYDTYVNISPILGNYNKATATTTCQEGFPMPLAVKKNIFADDEYLNIRNHIHFGGYSSFGTAPYFALNEITDYFSIVDKNYNDIYASHSYESLCADFLGDSGKSSEYLRHYLFMYTPYRICGEVYNSRTLYDMQYSEEYIGDVLALSKNEISAYDFFDKYGTHVVNGGTYGVVYQITYTLYIDTLDQIDCSDFYYYLGDYFNTIFKWNGQITDEENESVVKFFSRYGCIENNKFEEELRMRVVGIPGEENKVYRTPREINSAARRLNVERNRLSIIEYYEEPIWSYDPFYFDYDLEFDFRKCLENAYPEYMAKKAEEIVDKYNKPIEEKTIEITIISSPKAIGSWTFLFFRHDYFYCDYINLQPYIDTCYLIELGLDKVDFSFTINMKEEKNCKTNLIMSSLGMSYWSEDYQFEIPSENIVDETFEYGGNKKNTEYGNYNVMASNYQLQNDIDTFEFSLCTNKANGMFSENKIRVKSMTLTMTFHK